MAKQNNAGLKAALGLAGIAAAAGAYYFFGKNGKKHRQSAKAWMDKARREIVAELHKLKSVSSASYAKAAASVINRYKKFQKENPREFAKLSAELKGQWQNIQKHLPRLKSPVKKRAPAKRK